MTDVYIFSSKSTRNVEIAHERKLWAVSKPKGAVMLDTMRDRAIGVKIGSLGLFYVSARSAFTMPFTVASLIDDGPAPEGVWDGTWYFPFQIEPLWTPSNWISLETAKHTWLTLRGTRSPTDVLRLSGAMSFLPSTLETSDWDRIFRELAS